MTDRSTGLCLPRFDSEACFAKLLGGPENGYWRIAPSDDKSESTRRYRDDTLVLETDFETSTGRVRVVDCMPIRENHPQVVRVVEGLSGHVDMHMDLSMRFNYGSAIPWVRQNGGLLTAIAGPDALALWTSVDTTGKDMTTVADFTVREGERIPFVLTWYPSHETAPRPIDAQFAIADTETWWRDWASLCTFEEGNGATPSCVRSSP